MKSNKQRPKHLKKEKSNELEEIFKQVTEDFDESKYDDVYAIKQKELEAKILELLNTENFTKERISKLMAYFLTKYEKFMFNEAEIRLTTYKAKEKFEEIVEIEDSTPAGGRPQNDFIFSIANETFGEFEGANNGRQPSSTQLSDLVGEKLKKKLEILESQGSHNLNTLDQNLLNLLKQRDSAERNSGNRFYSESTALSHINRILKKRKSNADTQ